MAAVNKVSVPVTSVARELTIELKLHGLYRFKARLWLTTLVIKLLARVSPVGLDVETEDPEAWLSVDGRPPRRGDVGHPAYNHEVGSKLAIRLNGVGQKRVVAYDVDAGTVLRYNDSFEQELVRGEVTVSWRD